MFGKHRKPDNSVESQTQPIPLSCPVCHGNQGTNTKCTECLGKKDKSGCGCGGGGWVWRKCTRCDGSGLK